VKTKRGRILKVTGKHQLLGFNEGINWRKTAFLKKGDLIACPKEINLETEKIYDEDDAYFWVFLLQKEQLILFQYARVLRKLKNGFAIILIKI